MKKIERKLEDQFIQLKNSENQKIDTTNTRLRPFNKRGLTLRDFYIFNNYSTKIIPKDTLVTNNDVKKK